MKKFRDVLGLYTLEEKEPVRVLDVVEWAEKYGSIQHVLKSTTIKDVEVSTIFIGIDTAIYSEKTMLFETMIFGGKFHLHQRRYHTWDEAIAGHDQVCRQIRREIKKA